MNMMMKEDPIPRRRPLLNGNSVMTGTPTSESA